MATAWEAAGFSSQEEWARAGWPKPINPETGQYVTGYEELRMDRGQHPTGRKMTDEDWLDPKTQWIFDYLKTAKKWGSALWTWSNQMQAKYPNYPIPGVNIDDLIARLFPEGMEVAAPVAPQAVARLPVAPPARAVVPLITPPIGIEEPGAARWAAWQARREPARREPARKLPVMQRTREEEEAQRAAIRQMWLTPEQRARLARKPVAKGVAKAEVVPTIPPRREWIALSPEERAALQAVPAAPKVSIIPPSPRPPVPEEPMLWMPEEAVRLTPEEQAELNEQIDRLWASDPVRMARESIGNVGTMLSGINLPSLWTEEAVGQQWLNTLKRIKWDEKPTTPAETFILDFGQEIPADWAADFPAQEEYSKGSRELLQFLDTLPPDVRGIVEQSIRRTVYSGPSYMLRASERIIDPEEYKKWAKYIVSAEYDPWTGEALPPGPIDPSRVHGDLVEIEPGVPLKPNYYPVGIYDADVITMILREEQNPLSEALGQTLLDPTLLFWIPEVRAVPGRIVRGITELGRPKYAATPLGAAEKTFAEYKAMGGLVPEYAEEFLKIHRTKPPWYQQAVSRVVDDWFKPLASRYEGWKARGAPEIIRALPPAGGDLTAYMNVAGKAEEQVMRSYALVYPRAGTSDPNFLEIMGKVLSGGLNPAQVREMQALKIEADAYQAMGKTDAALEKVAALEKLAKEAMPLRDRWKLLAQLAKTKAGSMWLFRPTPGASAAEMADNFIRVLGWMFEDMESGIDRGTAALLFKKDPQLLRKAFPWIDSKAGLHARMIAKRITDESLGNMVSATGLPSENTQGAWTTLNDAARRIAGTYFYPSPRPDPWQRMVGQFYKIAPRAFLSTGRYPLQNITSNFANIWGREGWVTPRTDASSLRWVNRVMGDAGFLPPGFARSITAAGEVSIERGATLLGRKWTYERPPIKGREPLPAEGLEIAEGLRRGRAPTRWLAKALKRGAQYLPFGEGWINLSKWGERNASMADYRNQAETIKTALGQPGRGFLSRIPESIEPNPEIRAALEEIIGSSWNWREITERAAKLYGYKRTAKAAHFLSTERIRAIGPEAHEITDDLVEALSLSSSKAAFRRRYQLIRGGIKKQVNERVRAEPELPEEEVDLPLPPLSGASLEESQRLMRLTGTFERNQHHMLFGWNILTNLAQKAGMSIEEANRIAVLAMDKAWTAYGSYGAEAKKIYAEYAALKPTLGGQIWPAYQARREQVVRRTHTAFDNTIVEAAEKLGGDPNAVREELGLRPWAATPADMMARRLQDLQDDVINTIHTTQALELPLAPEGVEIPDDLESLISIRRWVTDHDVASQAWLEYMRDAIRDKELAEAAEKVVQTPAEIIKTSRRASWTEGTARRIELMEQKIARLQQEIATAPVEAADVEQLTSRQQEVSTWQTELAGLKETMRDLPSQREVFRLWDYKEGTFRKVKDPSGRIAEYAQSQIVQEIAHEKYGLEASTQGAEQYGDLIKQRLAVNDRVKELEGLIWEDPEIILPDTAEGLERFIKDSEPQLDQMMLYEREPYLFESALQAYEEAVDRLRKIRAGEAMPESVASSVGRAKDEVARLKQEKRALEAEAELRKRIPLPAIAPEVARPAAENILLRFPEEMRAKVKTIRNVSGLEDVTWTHSTGELTLDLSRSPEELYGDIAHELGEALIGRDPQVGLYARWVEFLKGKGITIHPTRMHEDFANAVTDLFTAPEKLSDDVARFLKAEGLAPEVARPAGIPTMITSIQREGLRELGYSDAIINQMTPEVALGLIKGQLSDFVPPRLPSGPLKDVERPVMPPSPREGAELKRDMLLERMDEWYKDALKEFDKPLKSDPTTFKNVERWLEDELRGQWGQFKIYIDKMSEATTAWGLHDYRKGNMDTILYRAFFWPYWQTRTGYKWLLTFIDNPQKLALWVRFHDTQRKINDDLPENYRDTVHIPDWLPVVGGKYWNPYFFFDPIYPWIYSLENFIPTWRREGLARAMVTASPISPLVGMSEWLQPMVTEEGRRVEPITPWTRVLYERTGINLEAGVIKALETTYGEIKPSIYAALERGGTDIGRPELAKRLLGGPEVTPMIVAGKYQPTYLDRIVIDMWLAGEITEKDMNEAMANREGPIWKQAEAEMRAERGLTEFSSILTGMRARKLYPSELEIDEFQRRRGILRTMEEGPEKRAYREEIYKDFPWARQWDVRYSSAETAQMELTISEAWTDLENQGVISEKRLADAIRSRPGDLAYQYQIKQENRKREEEKRSFWQRKGVSFAFNPRTRTYQEIEDRVKGQILGLLYDHLPQAEKFTDTEGITDWDALKKATTDFWRTLPTEIIKWGDIQQMSLEIGDAMGTWVDVIKLAKEVANEKAYERWKKANDIPEEALNEIYKKYIIDTGNEYYQTQLKDLEYADRNMPTFFSEFGQRPARELIPYILQEYPGRWTEEELTARFGGITLPGIWEYWRRNDDEREIALALLQAFVWGQTVLGRRQLREILDDPIFDQFFLNKETRDYGRFTNEELKRWLIGPNGEWNIPNPWEDKDAALRTLYHWQVDSGSNPLLFGISREAPPVPPTPTPEPGAEAIPPTPTPTPTPTQEELYGKEAEVQGLKPVGDVSKYYPGMPATPVTPESFPPGWPYLPQWFGRKPPTLTDKIALEIRAELAKTKPQIIKKIDNVGALLARDRKRGLVAFTDTLKKFSGDIRKWIPSPQKPSEFWPWLEEEYPIAPEWREEARRAIPISWGGVLEFGAGGFEVGTVDLLPPLARFELAKEIPSIILMWQSSERHGYQHELAHHMDNMLAGAGGISRTPEWKASMEKWRDDPSHLLGKEAWNIATVHRGTKEQPAWWEAYAEVATYSLEFLPPYIRVFYPWREGAVISELKEGVLPPPPAVPEARRRPPGLAAPMLAPEGPGGGPPTPPVPPISPTGEPITPSGLLPKAPGVPGGVPQLAGTSESAEYDQARAEMQAWAESGKKTDWTPLMEKWFGRDTPASGFWEFYWAEIPPGRIASDIRGDPLIAFILNPAYRQLLSDEAYSIGLGMLKTWRGEHPQLPGDPKEWNTVNKILKKYGELKAAGATSEASALWTYFGPLLEKYYPSTRAAPTQLPIRGRGGGGAGAPAAPRFNTWEEFKGTVEPQVGQLLQYYFQTPKDRREAYAAANPSLQAWLGTASSSLLSYLESLYSQWRYQAWGRWGTRERHVAWRT